MKRKPKAEDRDIADAVRGLRCGLYSITVRGRNLAEEIAFMGPAELKAEGTIRILFEDKTITILPEGLRR